MEESKKKILNIILIVLAAIIFLVIVCNRLFVNNTDSDKIPDDYIAVFHGGSGEIVYETYIYKEDTGAANYGFKYINVTKTTKSWGSSEWNTKITGRGKAFWTDDVFPVAEKNHAYSYVTIKDSDKKYTISEFAEIFLMN